MLASGASYKKLTKLEKYRVDHYVAFLRQQSTAKRSNGMRSLTRPVSRLRKTATTPQAYYRIQRKFIKYEIDTVYDILRYGKSINSNLSDHEKSVFRTIMTNQGHPHIFIEDWEEWAQEKKRRERQEKAFKDQHIQRVRRKNRHFYVERTKKVASRLLCYISFT